VNSLLFSALIGAILATCIAFIGRSHLYFLSGLMPLFPSFALLAQIEAFNIGGAFQVKQVAIFGLVALVPYAGYLLALILLIDKADLRVAMSAAIGAWFALAIVSIVLWDATIEPRLTQHV
jgi:membrane protein GlpM